MGAGGVAAQHTGFDGTRAWAKVDALPGFGNGALWPSLSRVWNVGNHGRYFFQQIKPGTYEIERVSDDLSVSIHRCGKY